MKHVCLYFYLMMNVFKLWFLETQSPYFQILDSQLLELLYSGWISIKNGFTKIYSRCKIVCSNVRENYSLNNIYLHNEGSH